MYGSIVGIETCRYRNQETSVERTIGTNDPILSSAVTYRTNRADALRGCALDTFSVAASAVGEERTTSATLIGDTFS